MPNPFGEPWFDLLLLAFLIPVVAYCYYSPYRVGRTLGRGS
jgi:hypothetical protein